MAVFADPARALRAALEIQRDIAALRREPDGPALVVAHRIDAIARWLEEEGLSDQFHPSYTRMVPAHYVTEIRLLAEGQVDTIDTEGFLPTEEGGLSPLAYLAETPLTEPDPAIRDFASRWPAESLHEPASLVELAASIRAAVVWEPGATTVEHDAAQALALGRGVCQDHAHVFASICRLRRIPVRYVSGYLHTGESSFASHAWVDAWLGAQRGWFSIDITNSVPAGSNHCRLAVGRDYLDAGPVRGVRRGGGTPTTARRMFSTPLLSS